jgi:hypothetical protein
VGSAISPSAIERDPMQIDQTLSRIQTHKGVQGVMVLTWEGNVIRSNLDNVMTIQYSNVLLQVRFLLFYLCAACVGLCDDRYGGGVRIGWNVTEYHATTPLYGALTLLDRVIFTIRADCNAGQKRRA